MPNNEIYISSALEAKINEKYIEDNFEDLVEKFADEPEQLKINLSDNLYEIWEDEEKRPELRKHYEIILKELELEDDFWMFVDRHLYDNEDKINQAYFENEYYESGDILHEARKYA